jgi:hypothetical protein
MNAPVPARRPSRLKLFFWLLIVPAVVIALYFFGALNWNYASGERAGWVQKLSKKGWICKTWEGELAMVSMPGATPEKFYFTVWDEDVADQINAAMGRRVTLHYEEKVGLPTTCFGDTRHWVNGVAIVPEIPLAPGITVGPGATVPAPSPATAPSPAAAPAAPTATAPSGPTAPAPGTTPSTVPPAPGSAPPSTPPPVQPPIQPAK